MRAIRIYLRIVGLTKPRPRSLFVSPRCPSRSISKNAISYFLRQVIVEAGAVRQGGGLPRAHSIRGLSASAAFLKNWSVAKVLEAATWRTNSVFVSFYFKDLSFEMDGLFSLGPFVAAGTVIK